MRQRNTRMSALMGLAFSAAAHVSPIFGETPDSITGYQQKQERVMRKRIAAYRKKSSQRSHQGKQECARRKSQIVKGVRGGQYPEHVRLALKNYDSGKWKAA